MENQQFYSLFIASTICKLAAFLAVYSVFICLGGIADTLYGMNLKRLHKLFLLMTIEVAEIGIAIVEIYDELGCPEPILFP